MKKDLFNKKINVPFFERVSSIIHSFSFIEKILFGVFVGAIIIVVLSMLLKVNTQFLVEIPQFGGEIKEGVVGSPRFVNPVLALSDTDKDLSQLLYSGLMRVSVDGNLIPDLAESYEVSENGQIYTFKLKDDIYFHDGERLTTDDIVYTIQMIMEPVIKSPLRGNWEGITVEKVNEQVISFHLPEAYSPFIYNMTLGILPKHIWESVTPEEFAFNVHNTDPVGSGPYKTNSIKRNESGIIEQYNLRAFDEFALGRPYIKEVTVTVFKNSEELKDALLNKKVTSGHTLHPTEAVELEEKGANVLSIPLPRIFGIFYNQSQAPVLGLKSLRRTLDAGIDRNGIVESVLHGYGTPTSSVIPPTFKNAEEASEEDDNQSHLEKANEIASSAGWEKDENGILSVDTEGKTYKANFSLATNNVPELVEIGEKIIADWREIGINAELKVFETNDISNTVIRPREFDALLFGEIVGRDVDLYAFWHSSQRNDPGLNITGYTNVTTDTLLEDARKTSDPEERNILYNKIEEAIQTDLPASIIYSPNFIYVLDKKVTAFIPETVVTPSDRFADIYTWYIDTETVWKIFAK